MKLKVNSRAKQLHYTLEQRKATMDSRKEWEVCWFEEVIGIVKTGFPHFRVSVPNCFYTPIQELAQKALKSQKPLRINDFWDGKRLSIW